MVDDADMDFFPDEDSGQDDPVADQSWMWQYCSEYGVFSSPIRIIHVDSWDIAGCRFLSTWRSDKPTFHRDCLPFSLTFPIPVQ